MKIQFRPTVIVVRQYAFCQSDMGKLQGFSEEYGGGDFNTEFTEGTE
jgi:hypothetical protein